jgi:hypothetical protein
MENNKAFTPRILVFQEIPRVMLLAAAYNLGVLARSIRRREIVGDRHYWIIRSADAARIHAFALQSAKNICTHNSLRAHSVLIRTRDEIPFGVTEDRI